LFCNSYSIIQKCKFDNPSENNEFIFTLDLISLLTKAVSSEVIYFQKEQNMLYYN